MFNPYVDDKIGDSEARPKDNKYLDVAINGSANVLITGDQDLLILHPYRGILPILSSSDFVRDDVY